MKRAILAVTMVLLGVTAWAQSDTRPQGRRAPRKAPGEEAFKMVKAYILSNLQERLELDDEQYARVFPLVNRLQDHRHDFAGWKHRALGEMTRLLHSGKATEARLAKLLEQLRTIEGQEPAAIAADLAAIDAELDTVQQAKYRVYEMQVERRIRELTRARRPPAERRQRREPATAPSPE